MILTDHFVFLHPPKTGGTFCAAMIEQIYPSRARQLRERLRGIPPLGTPAREEVHKHAPRHRIPMSHAHLPVIATVRSPYEHYVSAYEFAEWKKGRANPEFSRQDWDRVERDFPNFPELSFAGFLRVFGQATYRTDVDDRIDLGWNTIRYANQFVADHPPDVRSPTAEIVDALLHRTTDVRFIHTEDLNRELYAALGDVGVPEARRRFILDAAKVLPTKGGRRADQGWRGYYDGESFALVRTMDAAMFTRFPEYADLGLS